MEEILKHLPQDYSNYKFTFNSPILSFTLLIIVFSTAKVLIKLLQLSKLSQIPQLPSIPILGPFYPLIWQRDFSKLFTSWLSTYGSTFRMNVLGTEYVILSNPEWLQKLFTSSDPGHLTKYPLFYNVVFHSVLRGGLASQSNIQKWKHNRSVLSRAFSLESLKADLRLLNKHAKQLIDNMNDVSFEESTKDFEQVNKNTTLHAKLRESTYQTTGELFLGVDNISKKDEFEIEGKLSRCEDILSYRLHHPWCLFETVWNFFPQKNEMDSLAQSVVAIFENIVNIARENVDTKKSVKTFMDIVTKGGLNNKEIVTELATYSLASYDLQSVALNNFLYIMALHPEYQKRCQNEIDGVFESLSKNFDSLNEELSFDNLTEMKYLEMCIKESLRIFPPVPAFVRELKSQLQLEENLVLDKGTVVIVAPALIHRDPQVYPDPTIYNPDRFLQENCKARSVYSYIPYSKGPRDCIGQRLSMMHIKLLVAHILRRYELFPESPDDNLSKVWDSAVWPAKDLGVRWRKRT